MLDLLFPGRTVALESSLALEEVARRLEQEIAAPAWALIDRPTQLFQGSFADGRFQMMRTVKGAQLIQSGDQGTDVARRWRHAS